MPPSENIILALRCSCRLANFTKKNCSHRWASYSSPSCLES
ncbi:SWIM zinc finger family protein [Aeromonas hydrophila]